jgi:hypothetical protein
MLEGNEEALYSLIVIAGTVIASLFGKQYQQVKSGLSFATGKIKQISAVVGSIETALADGELSAKEVKLIHSQLKILLESER